MEEFVKEKLLYKKAKAFMTKFSEVLKKADKEDYEFLKDDLNIAMFRMRDAIGDAYSQKEDMLAMSCFAAARGKSAALRCYLDILAHSDTISKGDSIELQFDLSEINTELTSIMRAINPDVDKWRDQFVEDFKKGPEDEGYDEEE